MDVHSVKFGPSGFRLLVFWPLRTSEISPAMFNTTTQPFKFYHQLLRPLSCCSNWVYHEWRPKSFFCDIHSSLMAVAPPRLRVRPSHSFIISHRSYLSPSSAILFAPDSRGTRLWETSSEEEDKERREKHSSSITGRLLRQQSRAGSGCARADVLQRWTRRSTSPIYARQLGPLL